MINWKIRVKSKVFWLSIIPALLVLIKQIAEVFGYYIEIDGLSHQLEMIIESAFMVLSIIGVVNDPTTMGFSDSNRALNYDELGGR